jgi:hypothetical protein
MKPIPPYPWFPGGRPVWPREWIELARRRSDTAPMSGPAERAGVDRVRVQAKEKPR